MNHANQAQNPHQWPPRGDMRWFGVDMAQPGNGRSFLSEWKVIGGGQTPEFRGSGLMLDFVPAPDGSWSFQP